MTRTAFIRLLARRPASQAIEELARVRDVEFARKWGFDS